MNRMRQAHLFPSDAPIFDPSDEIGDPLRYKDGSVTRKIFCNIRGCGFDLHGSKLNATLREFDAMNGDMLCASKINVDTTKPAVIARLVSEVHRQFQHSAVHATSSPIPSEKIHKAGGTMNVAVGNIVGRLAPSERDHNGRWTVQHLRGKKGRIISVVSVYQPCKDNRQIHVFGPAANCSRH